MSGGFLLDLNKCTGCQACLLACRIENGMDEACDWRSVLTFNERRIPGLPVYHLSLACHHCGDPPCMNQCPALAYARDEATGAVVLRPELCIGCKYCSWTCPFDAPRYRAGAGVMSKCTFCRHRLVEGLAPACVSQCPTGALRYGELDSNGVRTVPGFSAADCEPSIRFVNVCGPAPSPDCSWKPAVAPAVSATISPTPSPRISLRSEWPLAIFTWLAAILTATAAASTADSFMPQPAAFLALGLVALAVSSLHLGRKLRSWRAILNLRRSWLSREVLFFLLFLVFAAARMFLFPSVPAAGWPGLIFGAAALLAIDRVYGVALKGIRSWFHSAGSPLTGLFLTGAFLLQPLTLGLTGAVKLALYVGRKMVFLRTGRPWRPIVSLLRLGLPALWLFLPSHASAWPLLCLLAGELVDRLEYYDEPACGLSTGARQPF
jgi:Fe-S-cluster-containing dehydrogenase component